MAHLDRACQEQKRRKIDIIETRIWNYHVHNPRNLLVDKIYCEIKSVVNEHIQIAKFRWYSLRHETIKRSGWSNSRFVSDKGGIYQVKSTLTPLNNTSPISQPHLNINTGFYTEQRYFLYLILCLENYAEIFLQRRHWSLLHVTDLSKRYEGVSIGISLERKVYSNSVNAISRHSAGRLWMNLSKWTNAKKYWKKA